MAEKDVVAVSGLKKLMITTLSMGLAARISLYERMAAFLSAGIPVFETVEAIRNRLATKKDMRVVMLDEWLSVMKDGNRFSDAIRSWVPPAEYMMISSGERGDGLITGLKEATKLSSAASKIKKAIIAGSVLPAVLFLMLMGMLAGFDLYMAPVFKNLLPLNQWPDSAQTLYSISHAIVSFWPITLGGLVGGSIVISKTINRPFPGRSKFFDKFPPWSLYKNYQASSFLIGLASMLKAGVALNDALKGMMRNASPWMMVHLVKMQAHLKVGGSNYGDALNTGLFDDETAGDIIDYSKLSSFENAIHIIGEKMVETGVERTNQRMEVAKNAMLFVVAGTVFWIYFTSYSLQNVIADKMQSRK